MAAYKVLFKSRWDRNVLVWILWLTEPCAGVSGWRFCDTNSSVGQVLCVHSSPSIVGVLDICSMLSNHAITQHQMMTVAI